MVEVGKGENGALLCALGHARVEESKVDFRNSAHLLSFCVHNYRRESVDDECLLIDHRTDWSLQL